MFIRREDYDDFINERENFWKKMYKQERESYYATLVEKCRSDEKAHQLEEQNKFLKQLISKEGDTEVIKYNGKLFKITSRTNVKDNGQVETMDLLTVCIGDEEK